MHRRLPGDSDRERRARGNCVEDQRYNSEGRGKEEGDEKWSRLHRGRAIIHNDADVDFKDENEDVDLDYDEDASNKDRFLANLMIDDAAILHSPKEHTFPFSLTTALRIDRS